MSNNTPDGVVPDAQIIEIVIQYIQTTGELKIKAPPDNILSLGMLGVAIEVVNSRGRENIKKSPIMRL